MEVQVKIGFEDEALKFLSAAILTLGGKLMGGVSAEQDSLATNGLKGMAGLTEEAPKKAEMPKGVENPKISEVNKEGTISVTKEQLNAAAVNAKTRLGGDITKIKELLAEFGAGKISEVAKMTESTRADFLARLEAL